MRSRRAALVVVLTAIVGIAAVLLAHTDASQPFQQRLGVFVTGPVVYMREGDVACQGPVGLNERTRALTFNPATVLPSGPAITVFVREPGTTRTLASGRLAAGFDPAEPQTVRLSPPAPAGAIVDVCFRDEGPGTVQLFGDTPRGDTRLNGPSAHPTLQTSAASLNGTPMPDADIAIVFPRAKPASPLALVPEMFRRAALFRPGWVGAWTYWLLAALAILAAPLLLWRALAKALAEEPDSRM